MHKRIPETAKKIEFPPRFEMGSMDKIEMEKIANFREKLCKISKK